MKNFKKIALTSAMVLGTIASTSSTVLAADTPAEDTPTSKTTTGVVKFNEPKDGALTLGKGANLDFGTHDITGGKYTLDNISKEAAQVKDLRGTNAGWTVSVKQTQDFISEDKSSTLAGAEITLGGQVDNGTTASPHKIDDNDAVVWTAGKGTGGYDSNYTTDATSKLFIPESAKVMAKNYTAKLLWTLSDGVDNA